jgi:sialidase-1
MQRSLLALPIIAVCVCTGASSAPVPVFAGGMQGYRCFRIPAIVETPDGTLLAFAEGRRNSCADFGDVQIVLRSSKDEGKTWSALRVVASNGRPQTGNPSPVVDALDPRYPKGRIFLFYNTGDAPESAIDRGQGTRRTWYRASVDEGTTWSAPVEITASVTLPSWRGYAVGPGHALQLAEGPHAGRIIVPANHTEGGPPSTSEAHTFYSDDHGRTWHLGATVDWRGSNESTVAEGADGSVVMNSRDQTGKSHARILSISKDGAAHWKATFVAHDLPDAVCEGSMIAYSPQKGAPLLLFSNAANTKERRELTISVSRDNGHTWPKHTLIDSGPSAYSDLVVMRNRRLGILWERGNQGGIVFESRPLAPLV